MKINYYLVIAFFNAIFFLHNSKVDGQCACTSETNITTAGIGWKVSFDKGSDDVAWSTAPIDDDNDGIADNGLIVVGSAYMGSGTLYDAYIMRLNPDGTQAWEQTIDGTDHKDDVVYAVEQTSTDSLIICGSTKTNYFGSPRNQNVWVMKMDLNGNMGSGWPKQYGSSGNDVGYDIKEDHDGNYVIVGTASANGNSLGTQTVNSDGDYWVFKISPNGYLNTSYSKVYSGSNSGKDDAHSLVIDCNSGEYVVSGFCKSCDPQANGNSQLLLLRIPTNFGTPTNTATYGNINSSYLYDYGSYNIIQSHDDTYGTCVSGDGFFSTGLQHPTTAGCFGTTHDFWSVKTYNDLSNNGGFTTSCVNADVGGAYGGKKQDNGKSAVQTCDGYILAGITQSNNNVLTCTNCEVTCNYYDCMDPIADDIWLAKVNSSGGMVWNESIGTVGNDGAYNIKQLPDGSYVVAGYTTNGNGDLDFYIVKFEIAVCSIGLDMSVNTSTYCATVSWVEDACATKYDLEYKKSTSSIWTTVTNATTPYLITDNLGGFGSTFNWRVKSYCSPTKYSYSTGGNFIISYCSGTLTDCTTCVRLGSAEIYGNNLLSVYPNPNNGSFDISLQLPDKVTELATIEILDQAERIVSSIKATTDYGLLMQHISINILPSGFYWVRIIVEGKSYKTKLVIQNQ